MASPKHTTSAALVAMASVVITAFVIAAPLHRVIASITSSAITVLHAQTLPGAI